MFVRGEFACYNKAFLGTVDVHPPPIAVPLVSPPHPRGGHPRGSDPALSAEHAATAPVRHPGLGECTAGDRTRTPELAYRLRLTPAGHDDC